jgi:hypothetical protein
MTPDEARDLFVRRVQELHSTRLIASGDLRTNLNLRAAIDQPVQLSVHEPDEEHLRSFLLTFRQFVSDKEPVFVRRIANELWRELTGDEIRSHLERARRRYGDALSKGSLKFVAHEQHFRPEEALDLWINGRYFHNDERKAATLDRLDPMSAVFVRQVFLEVLIEATRYIRFLADVIVIARRDGLL